MKVEWSREARADLARILTFNIDRSDQWAERVDSRLRQRAEALGQTPLMGRRIAFALRALRFLTFSMSSSTESPLNR